ncbi:major facilitator superfamily domain-containing protein [Infundibulicybe gibba]|nr:major facilitator superfamily domain-containing protein [Infundibulicybe gibba]
METSHDSDTKSEEAGIDHDSLDLQRGDEALKLIGARRTTQFTEEYNKKLRRKLDKLIIPLCAAVYFTQLLDKTSLNYASIMGFPIIGQDYNLVSLAFYLGFLLWEFPTVYISQKLRLAKYLGVNVVIWGAILMLHAVGTSFGAFFALRFLLGVFESCVAPILILVISMFYKKDEQATRISWFYAMTGLSQIFGGFIAYVHSPVHARFLTKEERIAALERVRDDQGGTENKTLKKGQLIEAMTDIRTWLIVLTTLMTSIPNGGLGNFSNLIIKNFGYTSKQTLILSTPIGVVTIGERMIPIVFSLVPTIVGAAIVIGLNGSGQKGALLFGTYLVGTFGSALSSIYAYNASNTSGHTKKNTVNAMTLVAFSFGNIIGAEIFQPGDAPDYIPGKIAVMVLLTVQLGISFLLRWVNMRLNIKKQAQIAEMKARHGWTDADVQREREKHAFADLTDKE